MASRKTPPPKRDSFYPPSENAVYRDLLLFEERLKTNASLLKKRKHRYQLFLTQLLAIIVFLAFEVMLETHFLDMPCNYALQKAFPEEFGNGYHAVELHPFVARGLLFVSITTLLLFFASGLYGEKIAYANRYVPQANRALRNFNMYFNVRHRPLRSRLSMNPLTYLLNRGKTEDTASRTRSPSPEGRRKRGTSVPIPPIPPTNNPRGELIFSSRVDRNFRESYERYRAAFERKREERELYALAQTWRGWRIWPWNWMRRSLPHPASYVREHASMSMRGRGSDSESNMSTPSSSRRPSPAPGSAGRSRGGAMGGGRSTSPPSSIPRRLTPDGTKSDNFSFLLSNDESFG
ncbi:hypothetical protein ACEPAH_2948 [Sanghuangporus vaninii]